MPRHATTVRRGPPPFPQGSSITFLEALKTGSNRLSSGRGFRALSNGSWNLGPVPLRRPGPLLKVLICSLLSLPMGAFSITLSRKPVTGTAVPKKKLRKKKTWPQIDMSDLRSGGHG